MILTIKVIAIVTIIIMMIIIIIIIIIMKVIIIIIIIIIKCRGRCRTPTTTNTELLVTLQNGRKPLSNIKKSSPSDAVSALYTPLKRLIHLLTWWIGVDHAAWIPCLELSPIWFLKNNCNGDINQHSNNDNSYNENNSDSNNNKYNNINNNNNNNNNNNSNNVINMFKSIVRRWKITLKKRKLLDLNK